MSASGLIVSLRERAKKLRKTVVLPDATDERMLKASRILCDEEIAHPVLVGTEALIRDKAAAAGVSLEHVRIVDPASSEQRSAFAHLFFNLRKSKGIALADAERAVANPLFFGAMMVREGMADGSVAGSLST